MSANKRRPKRWQKPKRSAWQAYKLAVKRRGDRPATARAMYKILTGSRAP